MKRPLKARTEGRLMPLRRTWGACLQFLHSALRSRSSAVEVLNWIKSQEVTFQRKLLIKMDPGRVMSLMQFATDFSAGSQESNRIAVVSGSLAEPELRFFPRTAEVVLLNFADNETTFDLTKDWSGRPWQHLRGSFDIVLCEQVLEHLIDPARATKNLALLLRPGGKLHVSAPAINNRHGEPHYFYAGFATEALSRWLSNAGMIDITVSSWSSDKGARMYSTCDWAPIAESGPLIFFTRAAWILKGHPRQLARLAVRRCRNFLRYPLQSLFPFAPSNNAVVVWAHARSGSRDE